MILVLISRTEVPVPRILYIPVQTSYRGNRIADPGTGNSYKPYRRPRTHIPVPTPPNVPVRTPPYPGTFTRVIVLIPRTEVSVPGIFYVSVQTPSAGIPVPGPPYSGPCTDPPYRSPRTGECPCTDAPVPRPSHLPSLPYFRCVCIAIPPVDHRDGPSLTNTSYMRHCPNRTTNAHPNISNSFRRTQKAGT